MPVSIVMLFWRARSSALLSGLGETGSASEVGLILPYVKHPKTKVRKVSIRAICRLDPEAHINVFMHALQDKRPGVSREATRALSSCPRHLLDAQALWEYVVGASEPWTKANALSLLSRLSKWDSIYYLIHATCLDDEVIVQRAHSQIGSWRARFNRSFLVPTPEQAERLSKALEERREYAGGQVGLVSEDLLHTFVSDGASLEAGGSLLSQSANWPIPESRKPMYRKCHPHRERLFRANSSNGVPS